MTTEEIKEHNRQWFEKIYNQLMEKAKSRGLNKKNLSGYYEKHHIKPKCMFPKGTSKQEIDKDNTVLLTAREHAIAHMLLQRIYPDNYKLIIAVVSMLTGPKSGPDKGKTCLSTRQAEYYRKLFSEAKKNKPGHKQTEATRKKISEANKGRKFTEEQSRQHSIKMKNRIITEEWKKNISKGMTGKKHPHKSPNLSDAVREKKAEICRQRVGEKHPNSKRIQAPNGKIYPSITACAKDYGITRENLSHLVNHQPEKGFKFI